jgi:dihydroorotate dehydrogenase
MHPLGMNLYQLAKPVLFSLDPEKAHHLTLHLTSLMPQLARMWASSPSERLSSTHWGQSFSSPLGLAAGLDKNAQSLDFFARLGLGALECGTVTLKPQIGNPLPRMFRYPEESSLRNSMGFPNDGAEQLSHRLLSRPASARLGVNIGKSKDATPLEAIDEYRELYDLFAPHSDWVTVNISSPNTQGLRDLQNQKWLASLLQELISLRERHRTPLLVKLSPDMPDEELKSVTQTLINQRVDGIIATNTTHMPERGIGGVSGKLLRVKAHQKRKFILDLCLESRTPVVGVGGIESFEDILGFWAAGGTLFQIYTAFVFHGPALVGQLHQAMDKFMLRAQLKNLDAFFALPLAERQKLIGLYGR